MHGDCCSKQFCNCNNNEPQVCPGDEVYCTGSGGCLNVLGNCEESSYCCIEDDTTTKSTTTSTTTTTTTSTTTTLTYCEIQCEGVDQGFVGECCNIEYCDCTTQTPQSCSEGQSFCTGSASCEDDNLFGGSCIDSNWCCIGEETTSTTPKTTMPTTTAVTITTTILTTSTTNPSTTTTEDVLIDCHATCGNSDNGLMGTCCDQQYCDCSNKDEVASCAEGEVFCTGSGGCLGEDGFVGSCEDSYCCLKRENKLQQESVFQSSKNIDCKKLCADQEVDSSVGDCCSGVYCYCGLSGQFEMKCQDGYQYCPYMDRCMDMTSEECDQNLNWCCTGEEITTLITTDGSNQMTTITTTSITSNMPETTTVSTATTSTVPTITTTTSYCEMICNGETSGSNGECCSDSYCDCSNNNVQKCSDGEIYCTGAEQCMHLFGESCADSAWCCLGEDTTSSSTTSSTTETTTTTYAEPLDCSIVCNGLTQGVAGACCDNKFCDCLQNISFTCSNDQVFCTGAGGCIDLYGETCQDSIWCCI